MGEMPGLHKQGSEIENKAAEVIDLNEEISYESPKGNNDDNDEKIEITFKKESD